MAAKHARLRSLAGALIASLLVAGCESGPDQIVAIDGTTFVGGLVALDRNGSGTIDAGDTAFAGAPVQIRAYGSGALVTTATTGADGVYRFPGLPVGTYRISLDPAILGDTLEAVALQRDTFTVGVRDTVVVIHTIRYPFVSPEEARAHPAERRVFVEGVALQGWGTFGDASLHVQANGSALRATRVEAAAVALGDSVRLRGTLRDVNGHRVLDDVRAYVIRKAVFPFPMSLPSPDTLTTAAAATADDGRLDAAQVHITAEIRDTLHRGLDFVTVVDDGSGPLHVHFDRHVDWTRGGLFDPALLAPGASIEASGLLVRRPDGSWQLRPRLRAEVVTRGFALVNVEGARASEPGRRVTLTGTALTGWSTFGDATVHLMDGTGSMRLTRASPLNLAPGDSVRVVGTVSISAGQPVLDDVGISMIRRAVLPFPQSLPPPPVVDASTAHLADAGRLDAAQVRVVGLTITSTAMVSGDFVVRGDDGSGMLDVVFDQHVEFSKSATFDPALLTVGRVIDVGGVLVPTGGADWQLKPRVRAEVAIK
jgi:hypothetical protein